MTGVFDVTEGSSPLVVSVPHDGRLLAPGQAERMTAAGNDLPDTDWHVRRLYEFVSEFGASVIAANYSRYVVDLNRPANDASLYPGRVSTGICPTKTFAGDEIYRFGETIAAQERSARVAQYWQPYHEKLRELVRKRCDVHGYALLWDAHSISSEVPVLFDGQLPHLNIGTDGGTSCSAEVQDAVSAAAAGNDYTTVLNGRFKGGYITRHYGDPDARVHAVQLEISQRAYMDENTREYDETAAGRLRKVISAMISAALDAAH